MCESSWRSSDRGGFTFNAERAWRVTSSARVGLDARLEAIKRAGELLYETGDPGRWIAVERVTSATMRGTSKEPGR